MRHSYVVLEAHLRKLQLSFFDTGLIELKCELVASRCNFLSQRCGETSRASPRLTNLKARLQLQSEDYLRDIGRVEDLSALG